MAQIIERISTLNPSANSPSVMLTSNSIFLISIIATNKSSTENAYVSVWVAPEGDNTESARGYIASGLAVSPSNTLETIRFAIVDDDVVYVESSSASTSFTCQGVDQLAL